MKTFHPYNADTETPFTAHEKFVLPNGYMDIAQLEHILMVFKVEGRVAIYSAGAPYQAPNLLQLGAALAELARTA